MNKFGKGIIKKLAFAGIMTMMIGAFTGCTTRLNYLYKNADKFTPGDRVIEDKIENINIDYLSGNVTLTGTDTDAVKITETSNKELDDKRKVHTWVDGNTLYVRYCASAKNLNFDKIEKELDIEVPGDVKLSSVNSDVSSGGFKCNGIEADIFDAECSSGGIEIDCSANEFNLEASSGSITLNQRGESQSVNLEASSGKILGTIENTSKLKAEGSSGNVELTLGNVKELVSEISSGNLTLTMQNVPETSSLESSSGDITIYAPASSGITAKIEVSSGNLNFDYPFEKKGETYICGDGACRMDIEASSGNVSFHKISE